MKSLIAPRKCITGPASPIKNAGAYIFSNSASQPEGFLWGSDTHRTGIHNNLLLVSY